MEVYERIKSFRKSLNLSQSEFGKKLGTTRDVISNIEQGRVANPEQKKPLYKLMCKTYGLNEEWLLYGTGEQFAQLTEDDYTNVVLEIGISDERAKEAILKYWQLSDEDKELFWDFAERFLK